MGEIPTNKAGAGFSDKVKTYLEYKDTISQLESKNKELRKDIMVVAKEKGIEDEKGNMIVKDKYGNVVTIQKRVSMSLDTEKALEYCKKHKITYPIEVIETINEDKFEIEVKEGHIPDDAFKAMMHRSETEALTIKKG